MAKKELGLVFGGKSLEHPISVMSAKSIIKEIDREKYNVIPIWITPEGQWYGPWVAEKVLQGKETSADRENEVFIARRDGVPALCYVENDNKSFPLDIVFPALHGPFGEDGTIQGLFETIGVPYVGSGVIASALGMDKGFMKEIFARKGLPQTEYYIVEKENWRTDPETGLLEAIKNIGFPSFVKPAALGSSMGIAKAKNRQELGQAIENAMEMGQRVLVEKMVSGRELECSVLGNERPMVAGPGEVVSHRDFYDYQAKYTEGEADLIFFPDIPKKDAEKSRELALQAFQALGCRGMARVDFFYPSPGQILINELNTIPGFTQFSMYPKLLIEEGIEFSKLIDILIELALDVRQGI